MLIISYSEIHTLRHTHINIGSEKDLATLPVSNAVKFHQLSLPVIPETDIDRCIIVSNVN